TGGSIAIAVDAIRSSRHPHHFLSVTKQGLAGIVETEGNPDTHLILRGGGGSPNYDVHSVARACAALRAAGIDTGVMVDCSHANSGKDPSRQPEVAQALAQQIQNRSNAITGVLLESFLLAGIQSLEGSVGGLRYGQSITDGCLGWEQTEPVLESLAEASQRRMSSV